MDDGAKLAIINEFARELRLDAGSSCTADVDSDAYAIAIAGRVAKKLSKHGEPARSSCADRRGDKSCAQRAREPLRACAAIDLAHKLAARAGTEQETS